MSDISLNTELLRAHGAGNTALLADLYQRASVPLLRQGDADAGCFFLTQAYVFALEAGLASSQSIRAQLREYGRED